MDERTYKVTYKISFWEKGINAETVRVNDWGACDALLLVSVIHGADGSVSYAFPSSDGDAGKELSDDEKFKIWAVMAHQLSESKTLGNGRRSLCNVIHETIKNVITGDDPDDDL